jgi:mycothiol synthase
MPSGLENYTGMDEKMENKLPEPYIARPVRIEDAHLVVNLYNAQSQALFQFNQETVNSILHWWQSDGLDLETDIQIILTPEGQAAGYIEFNDLVEPHVHLYASGYVHPDHKGRGIGMYLLTWAEERALKNLHRSPAEARVVLWQGQYEAEQDCYLLFKASGYALVRRYWNMQIDMEAVPEAPRVPQGIAIRSMVAGQEEKEVARTIHDSFQDHWGVATETFEKFYVRFMDQAARGEDFDPSLWFVGMAGDEMAGICVCKPRVPEDETMGYVRTLGVRRAWRNQGLGLALLRHAFGEFYRRGTRKVSLSVDSGSLTGAAKLYERAGMREVRCVVLFEKELRPGKELGKSSL